ncbi:MAG: phosphatidylglycerophosphatase A [Rhodobacteraceae bacterium]|nr:phosphatidylglycerophosphatase A [Paracoccaceae bacterium]MCY4251351.1 phosphatidylglycerophosphatase A [Paracoccaceae bacterium]MCY4307035.1 phosphatidylglycerophosphatase A [Paracoccaceae bacterium]
MINFFSKCVLTLFGLGFFPFAPGTIASFAGIVIGGFLITREYGYLYLIILPLLFWWLGTVCLKASLGSFASDDPSEIVIDELVGQLIALWPLTLGLFAIESGILINNTNLLFPVQKDPGNSLFESLISEFVPVDGYLFLSLLSLFLLFRCFDIKKPFLVGRIDRRKTTNSVMLDDIVAGLFAGAVFLTFIFLYYVLS